jgi:hypothetical protein
MSKRPIYAIDTKVPVAQTRSEIETELTRFGATSFAYALLPAKASILFEFSQQSGNYTEGRLRRIALYVIGAWPTIRQALDKFEEGNHP